MHPSSKLHPYALTFDLNGHEASVWYQYDEYYIYCEQMDPYTLSDNVFGYNKKKSNLSIFACLLIYAPKLHSDALTLELNGHEASVWYQYDE